jgi:hypothetical protein
LVDVPAESLHILATKLHAQPAFQRVQGLATIADSARAAATDRPDPALDRLRTAP